MKLPSGLVAVLNARRCFKSWVKELVGLSGRRAGVGAFEGCVLSKLRYPVGDLRRVNKMKMKRNKTFISCINIYCLLHSF